MFHVYLLLFIYGTSSFYHVIKVKNGSKFNQKNFSPSEAKLYNLIKVRIDYTGKIFDDDDKKGSLIAILKIEEGRLKLFVALGCSSENRPLPIFMKLYF